MSLLKSAATVSVFTLLSRITGLIRDMLIARYFGVSAATDAFYVAFRIPNMLRRLFAEGAFSQAFVPMLSQVKEQQPEDEQKTFISDVFSLLGCAVFIASLLGIAFAPVVVWLIASGFKNNPETFDLAVFLTRCMFPYIIFMSLVSFAAAVLNTWKHFAVPAFTPVLLNVSFICCTLFLVSYFSVPIYTLAFAVILGGVLQLSMQFFALKRIGCFPRLSNPHKALKNANVRQVLKLMVRRSHFYSHQHQYSFASAKGRRDMAQLCRSSDGVSDGSAWGGPWKCFAAEFIGGVQSRRTRTL